MRIKNNNFDMGYEAKPLAFLTQLFTSGKAIIVPENDDRGGVECPKSIIMSKSYAEFLEKPYKIKYANHKAKFMMRKKFMKYRYRKIYEKTKKMRLLFGL